MSATPAARDGLSRLADLPPEAPKQYPAGRTCPHPDCTKKLSIYNRGPCCFEHDGWKPPRPRLARQPRHDWADAAPVREHLLKLISGGASLWAVELKTKVPSKTIRDIRDGVYAKCRKDTAEAIMRMEVES